MPSHRLVASGVTVLEIYDPEHDGAVMDCARELTQDRPCDDETFAARWRFF